jgi:hypothetical protein
MIYEQQLAVAAQAQVQLSACYMLTYASLSPPLHRNHQCYNIELNLFFCASQAIVVGLYIFNCLKLYLFIY